MCASFLPSVMSISSVMSFWLSRSTMWFILRDTGLVLDFLFFFRLPKGSALLLCSEFLSAKTNLTGLLSVRPISATVSHNGTCVEYSLRSSRQYTMGTMELKNHKNNDSRYLSSFEFCVSNDDGEFSRYTDTVRKLNNKQNGRSKY